jgi:hypothetical protein
VAGKRAKCPGCGEAIDIPAPVIEAGFQIVEKPEVVSDFEVVDEPAKPAVKATAKPASKKADPDVIEDFEVIDDLEVVEQAPKPAAKAPAKPVGKTTGAAIQAKPKRRDDDDVPIVEAVIADEPKPKKRRRVEEDEDDDYDDDDYDDRPRRKRRRRGPKDGTPVGDYGYAICYNCGADAASKVTYTLWGGFIGPAMISHVRCGRCGTTYNGKSGKSNNTAILIYILVSLGIGLAIAAVGIIAAASK